MLDKEDERVMGQERRMKNAGQQIDVVKYAAVANTAKNLAVFLKTFRKTSVINADIRFSLYLVLFLASDNWFQ